MVRIAELDALGASKTAEAIRNKEINISIQQAEAEKGKKKRKLINVLVYLILNLKLLKERKSPIRKSVLL
jgi:hypothetical protein